MNKVKVAIVSVPGMIEAESWEIFQSKAEVEYFEKNIIDEESLLNIIADKEYLLLNWDVVHELSDRFYEQVHKRNFPLKAISIDATLFTWARPKEAKKYGIKLFNTPNYSVISVAEYTLATLLLHVKKINYLFDERKTQYTKNDVLSGKTLGIVGYGNIGRRVERLSRGFDMKTLVWNRTKNKVSQDKYATLKNLFTQSDYISIHLKTTDQTIEMIDRKYLKFCKKGVVIINQADSALVNNDDMLEYLEKGIVAGYNTYYENKFTHKIQYHPNATIFPLRAWYTDHSLRNMRRIWVTNIVDCMKGKYANLVE